MININTPEDLAQDLLRLQPDVVPAICGQILDITPKKLKAQTGSVIIQALFLPKLITPLVQNGVLGHCVEEIERRQVIPMPIQLAPMASYQEPFLDIFVCRAAGQIGNVSPMAFNRIYPPYWLWKKEVGQAHIIGDIGSMFQTYEVIKKNPNLISTQERDALFDHMEQAKVDILGALNATGKQIQIQPTRVHHTYAVDLLNAMGWLSDNEDLMPSFDVGVLSDLTSKIENQNKKITAHQRKGITLFRRNALRALGGDRSTKPPSLKF